MLYMVEMDMAHAEKLAQWHDWYSHHLKKLVSIPGIRTAQRFRATAPASSPYLAIYNIADAGVLSSEAYLAKAGPASTGEWRPLHSNWFRNILDGIDELREIGEGERIVIVDRLSDAAPPLPDGFQTLRPVGLDRSIVERGLRIGGSAPEPQAQWLVRVFEPISTRIVEPAPAG